MTPPLVSAPAAALPASQAPSQTLHVMFVRSADSSVYSVSLMGASEGDVYTTAKAHYRSPIAGTCGNDASFLAPGMISSSAGRVYFLDGDTDVRSIDSTGTGGLVTKVPGSSQAVAMFSVSPDDQKIAVAVFDYRSHPVASRLYVEDLTGGGNHVDLPASSLPYRWPLGWHGGDLVVASDATPYPATYYYSPLPYRLVVYEVLDPASGRVVATLGQQGCQPSSSLPTKAGVACVTGPGTVGVVDWSGRTVIYAAGAGYSGGASVSPDGSYVAATDGNATLKLISSPALGGAIVTLGTGYAQDGGWWDSQDLVARGVGTSLLYKFNIQRPGFGGALNDGWLLAALLPGGY